MDEANRNKFVTSHRPQNKLFSLNLSLQVMQLCRK